MSCQTKVVMSYQRGQEVLRSKPFSYVLIDDAVSKVCDFCLISQDKRYGYSWYRAQFYMHLASENK